MTTPIKVSKHRTRFAVCVDNSEYPVDLDRWKIYQVLPDRDGTKHHMIRVIDESGEDYLYPEAFFKLVTLPPDLRRLYRTKSVV